MISITTVTEKLETLFSASSSWKSLIGSQFLERLGTFLGWAIVDANTKVDRAYQEGFIDSALNRASILAHGEGREYLPRKPVAATGTVTITNQGSDEVTLLRGREFMSSAQVTYTLEESVIIPALESVEASVSQRSASTLTFTVSEEAAYYEILFGRDLSPTILDFQVFVDEGDGEGSVAWEYRRLLTNSTGESLVYDEFYHNTDQIGIRFGTGDFGKIPVDGAVVTVALSLTDGDTTLLEKQSLWPVEEVTTSAGVAVSITVVVSTTIQNGSAQEDTEEMRRNLHYAPVYNEKLVWDNDYTFFLTRRFSDIVFAKAWGEEESEAMWGFDVRHINQIWLCVYSPDRDMQEYVMAALADVPLVCRNYMWHDPEHVTFTLEITGKVLEDVVISEAVEAVQTALEDAYGRESSNRRDVVLLSELYEVVMDTGYFEKNTGAYFEITVDGQPTAEFIYQMISIDMDGSSISFEWV